MSERLIVAWSIGYLLTAVLLVRNSGSYVNRIEALIAVTLVINTIYYWKEFRTK